MAPRFSHRNLPQQLLQARDALMAHFRPILGHYGLSEQQWRILRALDERGPLEPRELCSLCQIMSASMAGMLARMEESGLVQRNRFENDHRRVQVSLAPQGDALIDAMAPLIEQQYRNIEEAFGAQVLETLSAALEQFVGAHRRVVARVALPPGAPGMPLAD